MLTAQQNLEVITTRRQLNQLNLKITVAESPQQLDALLTQYMDTTVKLMNLLALKLQSSQQQYYLMSNIMKAQHERLITILNNMK